jgi:hypothetical protein
MVTAFLQGAEASGADQPTLAERLSVGALALKLRLNGSHAGPRWAPLYRVGHGVALIVLLYQAVAATAQAGFGVGLLMTNGVPGWYQSPFIWSKFSGLLWVPAFALFVLRRFTAARVLAMLAVTAEIALTAVIVGIGQAGPGPFGLGDASRWGWLAVSAVAVLIASPDAKASPRLWFGAYLVGCLSTSLVWLPAFIPRVYTYSRWIHGERGITTAALSIAMAASFVRLWPTRRSPHWLLALALVGGGISGMRLARSLDQTTPPFDQKLPVDMLDVTLVGTAAAGLIVGLVAWHRMRTRLSAIE